MKTTTAHTLGLLVSMPMLALGIVCLIQPPAVAKTVQYASLSEMQEAELNKLVLHHQKQCGHDDWLCLLAYADVTTGVKP